MDGANDQERLNLLFSVNSEWAAQVVEFVSNNNEFLPYLKYSSLTPLSKIPKELKTVKEMLVYYVCHSGVRASYGSKIYQSVREGKLDKLTDKKRQIIDDILNLDEITSKDDFMDIKIRGVGPGAISFVLDHYFHDENIIYPTDRIFQKGMAKIYGKETLTASQCKKIAEKWKGNKTVGTSFCYQAAHYS